MDSDWTPDTHNSQKRKQRTQTRKRKRGNLDAQSSRKITKHFRKQKPKATTRVRLSSAKKNSLLQQFDSLSGSKSARLKTFSSANPSVDPRSFRRWRIGSNRASIESSAQSKSRRVRRARVSANGLNSLSCTQFPDQEKAVYSMYKARREQSHGCSTSWFQSKMRAELKKDQVAI